MRVLQVADSFTNGGLERFILDVTESLVESGHEAIFAFGNSSEEQHALGAARIHTGFNFRKGTDITAAEFLADIERLGEIIEGESIDVVISHPFRCLFPAVIASQLAQKPVTYVVHGAASITFPVTTSENLLLQACLNHALCSIATVNPSVMDSLPNAAGRIVKIAQPVRPVQAAALRQTGNRRWVLASRLDADKARGISRLLEMLPNLPIDHIDLFGDGNARAEIEEDIARLGLEGRVSRNGYDPNWIERARESAFGVIGLGRVALEALSAGMPVLMLSPYQSPCGMLDLPLYRQASYANFNGSNLRKIDSAEELADQIELAYENPEDFAFADIAASEHSASAVASALLEGAASNNGITLPHWDKLIGYLRECDDQAPLFDSKPLRYGIHWFVSSYYADLELRGFSLADIERTAIEDQFGEISRLAEATEHLASADSVLGMRVDGIEQENARLEKLSELTRAEFEKELSTLEKQLARAIETESRARAAELESLRKELARMKASHSWKVGRAVTSVPRWVKCKLRK